jgi:hypothetical protein
MGNQGTPATRNCVQCGRSIGLDANVCPYCGHDYRALAQAPAKKKGVLPVVGGVLVIIAGLVEIISGAILVSGGSFIGGYDLGTGVGDILTICGVIWVILGLVAILGGIFAVMRKHFGLAILGAILGLGGYFIFALIGIILIAVGREDFD